ncbi:Putative E3 ubiquitin-protein ligase HTD2 [Chamberlinius hualienensis]
MFSLYFRFRCNVYAKPPQFTLNIFLLKSSVFSMNSNDGNLPSGEEAESGFIKTDDQHKEGFANTEMKRAAAKQLIERYYYQVTSGCGRESCTNEFCASSGKMRSTSANQAAATALQLFKDKAKLCESNPAKMAKYTTNVVDSLITSSPVFSQLNESNSLGANHKKLHLDQNDVSLPSTSEIGKKSESKSVIYLTESRVKEMIAICEEEKTCSLLIRTLGSVYSDANALVRSFLRDSLPVESHSLSKEDIRSSEADLDKDFDSKDEISVAKSSQSVPNNDVSVDLDSLSRTYSALFSLPDLPFQSALIHALISLLANTELDLRYRNAYEQNPELLNIFFIVLEIPNLHLDEFLENVVSQFCKTAISLPVSGQARLVRVIVSRRPHRIKYWVEVMHQLITSRIISNHNSPTYCVNDDGIVEVAVKFMKLLYYSAIMGGELDKTPLIPIESEQNDQLQDENLQELLQGAVGRESKEPKLVKEDPLVQELNVNVLDCRKPVISFEDFCNELLNDQIDLNKDFQYREEQNPNKFSFLNYHFILTPATKVLGLYYDNRLRMFYERRACVLQSLMHDDNVSPYLKLKVHRERLVDDALMGLEMYAMGNPSDLKKQLVVEFEGEQGIDEGGVSKEFFQLIVEEIFKPDFAMFTWNQELQTYWFNPACFESDAQFTLIGIVLGLAIYNNVILDIQFPPVVYRKLLGKRGVFEDLLDWDPSLYHGLATMLHSEDEDFDDVFMQTFRINYTDVFGNKLSYDLKENGDRVPVTRDNKREFVDLYADFLLNKSIEKQFRAFRRGFQLVTDESPLKWLCRPEEVELLVCGSRVFDFNALEESTEYDGGYTAQSSIIRQFWEVVHDLSTSEKRKLLQFTTGSDRVPVGGLSKLKLIIARHGPDSNRLPTAHTCFNVLLLPEYSGKEKLRERLLKAITYSKGFGML